MPPTLLILNKTTPILLFLLLGMLFRQIKFLSSQTIIEIKKLIVNICLPAVLFLSFLNLTIEPSMIAIVLLVFIACLILLFFGRLFHQKDAREYYPFFYTGFEFGMLGISLFATTYGYDQIAPMAVIGIGHEFFIWFVYLTLLLKQKNQQQTTASLLRSFVTSPVIIAIVFSLFFNITRLNAWLQTMFAADAVFTALTWLQQLTAPLILIVIGYDIHFSPTSIRASIILAAKRLLVLVPVAAAALWFVAGLLKMTTAYQVALATLLLLPPPFILPLYMRDGVQEQKNIINNAIIISTILSLIVFILLFSFFPTI